MTDRTELLEAALDSIPEGIVLLGEEGEVVFWNTAAEAITGHARVELVGRAVPVTLNALLDGPAPQEDSELRLRPSTRTRMPGSHSA